MSFTFNPGPPKDAYTFWQDKVPMSKKAFHALAEDDRVNAFVVAGMAKGDMLQAMYDSMANALATGQSMKAWKKDIRLLFAAKGWDQLAGFRLDNIFRTNIQTAYSVGRYAQLMDTKKSRPYWRYSAINDSRTRASHSALHGRVVRADDPFWDKFYPPNGYRCRCTVTSLSERDMKRKGYKAQTIEPRQILEIPDGPQKGRAVPVMPDNNFRENPGKAYWQADTARFRADVRQAVLKDITRACPDEFCGPCEFAETDCFKRLKRHLTQEDLTDLQTLVWAEGFRQKKGFETWVDNVLDTMQPKGELYPVANLPGRILGKLEKQPRMALITIDDKQLVHMAATAKAARGAALTREEIKQIPAQLASGRWWRDTEKDNYLVTWIRSGDQWLKVVINLDYRIDKSAKRIANHIITGGVVKESDIARNEKYEEI